MKLQDVQDNYPQIIDFIKNDLLFEDLSDSLEIEELYRYCKEQIPTFDAHILTSVLLGSDVEFLPFIKAIPAYCYKEMEINVIQIPDNVEEIKEGAFYRSEVSYIELPKQLKSIGNYAFYGCPNLYQIYYQGRMEDWNKISFGKMWHNNSNLLHEIHCLDGKIEL